MPLGNLLDKGARAAREAVDTARSHLEGSPPPANQDGDGGTENDPAPAPSDEPPPDGEAPASSAPAGDSDGGVPQAGVDGPQERDGAHAPPPPPPQPAEQPEQADAPESGSPASEEGAGAGPAAQPQPLAEDRAPAPPPPSSSLFGGLVDKGSEAARGVASAAKGVVASATTSSPAGKQSGAEQAPPLPGAVPADDEGEQSGGGGVIAGVRGKLQAAEKRMQEASPTLDDVRAKQQQMAEQVGDARKEMAARLDDLEKVAERVAASEAVANVKDAAGAIAERVAAEVRELVEKIEALARKLKEEAARWLEEKKAWLRAWVDVAKERLHLWILERVEELLDRGLDGALPRVRAALKDPYMPGSVKRAVDRVVDSLWHDVKEEIIEVIVGQFRPALRTEAPDPEPTCWMRLKAFVRYNLFPYDKSIWQSLRNPVFIAFKVLCLVPFPGLLQVLWFGVLICIDREDEFQLLQYISSFKSMQFFTLGIVKILVGATMFYQCTTAVPPDCRSTWTIASYESFGLIFLMLQVVVVWGVFVMVPHAKQKGSYHELLRADHARRGIEMEEGVYVASSADARKARAAAKETKPQLSHVTMWWLIYDVLIFLVCVTLGIVSMLVHANPRARVVGSDRDGGMVSNWRFTATLFWLVTLYGVCALPFLLFAVPFLSGVFTHAKPTGYNKRGKCVPFVGLPADVAAAQRAHLAAVREEQLACAQEDEDEELEESETRHFLSPP